MELKTEQNHWGNLPETKSYHKLKEKLENIETNGVPKSLQQQNLNLAQTLTRLTQSARLKV